MAARACGAWVLCLGLLAVLGGCASRSDHLAAGPRSVTLTAPSLAVSAEQVETLDFDWFDEARNRRVPARLYLPRLGDGLAAPVPLVVFSHGLGGSRHGYTYLGRYWASQGLATLHVQHEGSDRSVWTNGGWNVVASLRAAASESNALARAEDVSFAITRSLAEPALAGRLRADAIAVAGHSYGANTALLVGGAMVERPGGRLTRHDPRVRALVLISAPPIAGEGDMVSIFASVTVPTLHITGTDDVIRIPGYYSDLRDRIAVFEAVGGADKRLLVLRGATHGVFTDRFANLAPELNEAIKTATREVSALFLRSILLGDARERLDVWRATLERDGRAALVERFVAPVARSGPAPAACAGCTPWVTTPAPAGAGQAD